MASAGCSFLFNRKLRFLLNKTLRARIPLAELFILAPRIMWMRASVSPRSDRRWSKEDRGFQAGS